MATTFGAPWLGDMPVPGDFDGDGRRDLAVYRTTTGQWFVLRSSDGIVAYAAFGAPAFDDIPVPRDYDADGRTDLAVYRRRTGEWFIARSTLGFVGTDRLRHAVARRRAGARGLRRRRRRRPRGVPAQLRRMVRVRIDRGLRRAVSIRLGGLGDVPVPADYDGDGRSDLAVYRETTGEWFIFGSTAGFRSASWGSPDAR